jgi:hypothetical protein
LEVINAREAEQNLFSKERFCALMINNENRGKYFFKKVYHFSNRGEG